MEGTQKKNRRQKKEKIQLVELADPSPLLDERVEEINIRVSDLVSWQVLGPRFYIEETQTRRL